MNLRTREIITRTFRLRQSPGVERSKTTPHYNIGLFSTVQPQELSHSPNVRVIISRALIYRFLLLTTASLLFTSCQQSYLTVQTDYLSYKNLASYYVGTPDPRMNCPPIGQRLIISWSVPKSFLCYENLHLEVIIRFRNRQEQIELFNISNQRGTYVYTILNNDFIEKQGILTYKIDLVANDCVLEEWRHQIWAELIEIPYESLPAPDQLQEAPDIDWEG